MTYTYWIYILGLIGVLNTLYLSYHAITKTPVWCLFFPEEWCQKVQHSSWSKTLGIPNPYLGFGIYVLLIVLTYLYSQGQLGFAPLQWLVYIGFAFSMYFLFIQMFVLRAFCTWCVLSAVDFTLLFWIITRMS